MVNVKKIVFAQDFSPCAERALPFALDLARRTAAEVHMLFVEARQGPYAGLPPTSPAHEAHIRERLCRLGPGAAAHHTTDTRLIPAVAWDTAPAPGILSYAEQQGADMIIMGTHGWRGIRHLVLGSVAEEVVRTASCPVLTIRSQVPRATASFRSILVPVDFSSHAREALRQARELAWLYGAYLQVLHVVDVPPRPYFYDAGFFSFYSISDVDAHLKRKAWDELKRFNHDAAGPTPPEVHVEVAVGHAAETIVEVASTGGSDLIVMSTHGLRGMAHWLMGSVTEKVIRTAPCPVYTSRAHGAAEPAPGAREAAEARA